jgi:hypothetical protein
VLSPGPQPQRRGARRQYAGQVPCQTLSRFEELGTLEDAPQLPLSTAVGWHQTLQRRLRLVGLLNRPAPAQPRVIVLDATDPDLSGHQRVERSTARVQIALLCRDSTPFPGLLDCQARAASAFDLHVNASLATLNLVRAEA